MSWTPYYMSRNIRPSIDASRMQSFEDSYRHCVWLRKNPWFKTQTPEQHYLSLATEYGVEAANRVYGLTSVPAKSIGQPTRLEAVQPERNIRPSLDVADMLFFEDRYRWCVLLREYPEFKKTGTPHYQNLVACCGLELANRMYGITPARLDVVQPEHPPARLDVVQPEHPLMTRSCVLSPCAKPWPPMVQLRTPEDAKWERLLPSPMTTTWMTDMRTRRRYRVTLPATILVNRIITDEQYFQETVVLKDEDIYA